jgi:hypothetical protein
MELNVNDKELNEEIKFQISGKVNIKKSKSSNDRFELKIC